MSPEWTVTDVLGTDPYLIGGEGEIRTHEPRKGPPVFKTGAFNRSATSPAGCGRDFTRQNMVVPGR